MLVQDNYLSSRRSFKNSYRLMQYSASMAMHNEDWPIKHKFLLARWHWNRTPRYAPAGQAALSAIPRSLALDPSRLLSYPRFLARWHWNRSRLLSYPRFLVTR